MSESEATQRAAPTEENVEGESTRPTLDPEHERLIETIREGYGRHPITSEAVISAMGAVDRREYVTPETRSRAFEDRPLPIGHGVTISQPYIVALMTQLLDVEPTHKVLEIGTGSGYQAAVLAEITPHVFSIEIIEPLAHQAAEVLERQGYTSVRVRAGDGYRGWPEEAPFDRIIITAAPPEIPQPLLDQLAVGGRLVAPVGAGRQDQRLVTIVREADGTLTRSEGISVIFVPMTGEAQGQ